MESERFPIVEVRVGMAASLVRQLWEKGLRDDANQTCVRYVAMVVFAFIIILRESSVMNFKVKNVLDISEERCEVFVRFLKGRTKSESIRLVPKVYTFRSSEGGRSTLSVIVKHMSMTGSLSYSGNRRFSSHDILSDTCNV